MENGKGGGWVVEIRRTFVNVDEYIRHHIYFGMLLLWLKYGNNIDRRS